MQGESRLDPSAETVEHSSKQSHKHMPANLAICLRQQKDLKDHLAANYALSACAQNSFKKLTVKVSGVTGDGRKQSRDGGKND